MGIEKFFNSLKKSTNNIIRLLENKIKTDYLFFDFNSIIHVTSQYILDDLNLILKLLILKSKNIEYDKNKLNQLIQFYNLDLNFTYNDLINYCTFDKINELIVQHVFNYLDHIFQNYIDNKLSLIYIAIDGVPTIAKMIEQKKRRYVNYFYTYYKSHLLEKFKNKINDEEYIYQKLKINWSKNYISPGTKFMSFFVKKLKQFDFTKYADNTIISSYDEPDEAEFKIFKYIKHNNINNYIIYSPDADVILLALLLKKENAYILRFNQQTSTFPTGFIFELIDISLLNKTIIEYYEYDIISDVVFIFTFFGNDFLPKLESYNAKLDINFIIKLYKEYININKQTIIENNNLNVNNFIKLLEILLKYENEIIERNNLIKKYSNYLNIIYNIPEEYINNSFNYISFNDLNDFIKNYNLSRMRDNKVVEVSDDKLLQNLNPNENFKYIKYIKKFQHIRSGNLNILKLIENKHTVNTQYHEKFIRNKNQYEIEIYKLDNLLDEYYTKFSHKIEKKHDIKLYVEGLYWLVNYYYKNNINNSWFYIYNNKITIKEIYDYLKKNNNIKYNFPNDNNDITVLEQLFFIIPFELIFNDKNMINDKIQTLKLPFEKQINDEKKIINNLSIINCTDEIYFNKCSVNFDLNINNIIKKIRQNFNIKEQNILIAGDKYLKKYKYYKKKYNKEKDFINKYKYLKYKYKLKN